MNVLIVAGGTGGHLYPGIAVAHALKGHKVLFAVRRGDLGLSVLQKEGFFVKEIAGQGLPRSLTPASFLFPFRFLRGWFDARALLKEFKPDWVIGMGGYLSVPVILTAHAMRIKTMLHEQNVMPGLANRLLSQWVDQVAVSFPASLPYFPSSKTWVSGLPVRTEIGGIDKLKARQDLGLELSLPTFLVFGGSLGAQRLNTLVTEAWGNLVQKGLTFQVIHVTGTKDFERVEGLYRNLKMRVKVLPYCHDMPRAYAAADAVVCRAGASTIAELLAAKRPAFLVPYPFASNNHQVHNANVLEKEGLAKMALEKDLTPGILADYLMTVVSDEEFKRAFEKASTSLSATINPLGAAARLAESTIIPK